MAADITKNRKCCGRFDPTGCLAGLNYLILVIYGAFTLSVIQADPYNHMFMATALILGSLNFGVTILGLIGIFGRIEATIRGTFTILILEHIVGFILGVLLLVESLTIEPLTETHHGAKIAIYFLTKSRLLAIGLSVLLLIASLLGCFTLSYVAKWLTDVEAVRYLQDTEESLSLLQQSAEDKNAPIQTKDDTSNEGYTEIKNDGSLFVNVP